VLLTTKEVIDLGDHRVSGVIDLVKPRIEAVIRGPLRTVIRGPLRTVIRGPLRTTREAVDPGVLTAVAMARTAVKKLDPSLKMKRVFDLRDLTVKGVLGRAKVPIVAEVLGRLQMEMAVFAPRGGLVAVQGRNRKKMANRARFWEKVDICQGARDLSKMRPASDRIAQRSIYLTTTGQRGASLSVESPSIVKTTPTTVTTMASNPSGEIILSTLNIHRHPASQAPRIARYPRLPKTVEFRL
jgi:hypothetical protein